MRFLFGRLFLTSVLPLIVHFLLPEFLSEKQHHFRGEAKDFPRAARVQLLRALLWEVQSGCEPLQNDMVSHHRLLHIFELPVPEYQVGNARNVTSSRLRYKRSILTIRKNDCKHI